MFKAMILLKRRDDMSFAAFADWWLREHAPLAATLPKVRGLHFNVLAGDGSGDFDGVSELWFDSQADFEAAYATPRGQAVAADSMAHVSRRERLFVTEHRIVPGP
jgi:uncharacterized protein (TIGR02118 family)